jgi:hypothetical protein
MTKAMTLLPMNDERPCTFSDLLHLKMQTSLSDSLDEVPFAYGLSIDVPEMNLCGATCRGALSKYEFFRFHAFEQCITPGDIPNKLC